MVSSAPYGFRYFWNALAHIGQRGDESIITVALECLCSVSHTLVTSLSSRNPRTIHRSISAENLQGAILKTLAHISRKGDTRVIDALIKCLDEPLLGTRDVVQALCFVATRNNEHNKLQEPCQENTIPTLQPLLNAIFEFPNVNVQPTKNARHESNPMRHPSTILRTLSGLIFSTGEDKSSR